MSISSDNLTVVTSFGLESIDPATILGDNLLNDLDKDGLNNKSEINTDALEKFNPGKELTAENLITLQQFSEAIDKSTIDRFSDGVLAKYKDIKVLPLKSDPRKADSDGDGFIDNEAIAEQSKGYYKIADKWPLNSKPKLEFYQKDGNYYFNKIVTPNTSINGYKFSGKVVNLTEEIQKYIYDLCEIGGIDPLTVIAICAHESNCDFTQINKWSGATGLMQLMPNDIPSYLSDKNKNNEYVKNDIVKKLIDGMCTDLNIDKKSDLFINISNGTGSISQIQNFIRDPKINITLGIAKLSECFRSIPFLGKYNKYPEKDREYWALSYYCGVANAENEDLYIRNYIDEIIKEVSIYEEKFNVS